MSSGMASLGSEPGAHSSLKPILFLIFAWGNLARFPGRGQKGGLLALAGKREAGWAPRWPASATLEAQGAREVPDSTAGRVEALGGLEQLGSPTRSPGLAAAQATAAH